MVQREDVRYPRDQAPTVMTVAYGWGRPLDRVATPTFRVSVA